MHAFRSASANDQNRIIAHGYTTLYMQSIDFMLTLKKFKSPVGFLGILSCLFGPSGSFDVETCGSDSQLSIDDESEHGLIMVIDTDSCRNIVSDRQLW